MPQEIVLQRGRRAGNILLIQAIVFVVLAFFETILEADFKVAFPDLFGSLSVLGIYFGILMIPISGLKDDRIKRIRVFYIVLVSVLSSLMSLIIVLGLSIEAIIETIPEGLIGTAIYVLILIGLYKLGKTGKICCYIASGLGVLALFFSSRSEDFSFARFVSEIILVVFHVFLGLYVESKGVYTEEFIIEAPASGPSDEQSGSQSNKYEEIERLKELMNSGVITPAEYEEKKKQILFDQR